MGINEREHHIKVLENLLSHYKAREKCEGYYDSTLKDSIEALQYAISSLKTDEAYQLMYEGGEIYTKADLVAMLAELLVELKELPKAHFYKTNEFGDVTGCIDYPAISKNALDLIQQKINALKENI